MVTMLLTLHTLRAVIFFKLALLDFSRLRICLIQNTKLLLNLKKKTIYLLYNQELIYAIFKKRYKFK